MKVGIVGLPNVGKSTLFNAITQAGAEVANYPFCTIEANHGVVAVPDERLHWLSELSQSKKTVPALVEFVDIAGLVEGASRGEGLGNKFLGNIRETDAILHVVRCFDDPNITHVAAQANPLHDADIVNLELILADLEFLERRIQKLEKLAKSGEQKAKQELQDVQALQAHLAAGQPARTYPAFMQDLPLLSAKPVLYVANVSEADIFQESAAVAALREQAAAEAAAVVSISAKIEAEIANLEEEERRLFLDELGLAETGLKRVINSSYALLGLISFLTTGETESRAWTIKRGTKAAQAAGKIHSDMERGFIRAETVAFETLHRVGSIKEVREQGLLRSEGRDYVVQDGDVMLFRFNV